MNAHGGATQEREGVVRYLLRFKTGPAASADRVVPLVVWRDLLVRLGLVGHDPARYHGLGFGNLSRRIDTRDGGAAFVVTGTQTGQLATLGPEHFAVVHAVDLSANAVDASGPVEPSSEALTHAAVYAAAPWAQYVFHGHHPAIWRRSRVLGLPRTPAEVPYGTPAMAAAMAEYAAQADPAAGGLIVMDGHEDGVLCFAATAGAAGGLLVTTLARALETR